MPNDLPLILHKNGTATIEIDGKRITLRMPKVGEFERLRLSLHDIGEQVVDVTDDAAARSHKIDAQIVELGGIDLSLPEHERQKVNEWDLDDDVRRQIRDLRREQRSLQSTVAAETKALRLAWVREAIETLRITAGDLPEDDELPQWVTSQVFTLALVGHWQTTPLARGGG